MKRDRLRHHSSELLKRGKGGVLVKTTVRKCAPRKGGTFKQENTRRKENIGGNVPGEGT